MTDTHRFFAQDSLFALLVTYLLTGSRDTTTFDTLWDKSDRQITLDSITFPIVQRMPGENHEIPGVNIVAYDEFIITKTDKPIKAFLVTIHLYAQAARNSQVVQRSLFKLQRAVDEAMFGGGTPLVDFTSGVAVPLPGVAVSWNLLDNPESWLDVTNLEADAFIHKSRNFKLVYQDAPIS